MWISYVLQKISIWLHNLWSFVVHGTSLVDAIRLGWNEVTLNDSFTINVDVESNVCSFWPAFP